MYSTGFARARYGKIDVSRFVNGRGVGGDMLSSLSFRSSNSGPWRLGNPKFFIIKLAFIVMAGFAGLQMGQASATQTSLLACFGVFCWKRPAGKKRCGYHGGCEAKVRSKPTLTNAAGGTKVRFTKVTKMISVQQTSTSRSSIAFAMQIAQVLTEI